MISNFVYPGPPAPNVTSRVPLDRLDRLDRLDPLASPTASISSLATLHVKHRGSANDGPASKTANTHAHAHANANASIRGRPVATKPQKQARPQANLEPETQTQTKTETTSKSKPQPLPFTRAAQPASPALSICSAGSSATFSLDGPGDSGGAAASGLRSQSFASLNSMESFDSLVPQIMDYSETDLEYLMLGPALSAREPNVVHTVGLAVFQGSRYHYAAGGNVPPLLSPELVFGNTALRFRGTVSKTRRIARDDTHDTWLVANIFKHDIPEPVDTPNKRSQTGTGSGLAESRQNSSESLQILDTTFDWDQPVPESVDGLGELPMAPGASLAWKPNRRAHYDRPVALCLFLTVSRDSNIVFENWDELKAALAPVEAAVKSGKSPAKLVPGLINRLVDNWRTPRAMCQPATPSQVGQILNWAATEYGHRFVGRMVAMVLAWQPREIRSWRSHGMRTVVTSRCGLSANRILVILLGLVEDKPSRDAIESWRFENESAFAGVLELPDLSALSSRRRSSASSAVASESGWRIPSNGTHACKSSVNASAYLSRPSMSRSQSLVQTLNRYRSGSPSGYSTEDDVSAASAGGSVSRSAQSANMAMGRTAESSSLLSSSVSSLFSGRWGFSSTEPSSVSGTASTAMTTPSSMDTLRTRDSISSMSRAELKYEYKGLLPPVAGYNMQFSADRAIQACHSTVAESGRLVSALANEFAVTGQVQRLILIDLEDAAVSLWTLSAAGLSRAAVMGGEPVDSAVSALQKYERRALGPEMLLEQLRMHTI